jgi:signal transduction histidine kinase
VPLRLAVPLVLMAVLGVLAALQYRWLGQVSQAERRRMHETMTSRAQLLAADIDREISRVFLTFQLREAEGSRLEEALRARLKIWRETSRHPDLVKRIFVVSPDGALQAFDTAAGTLAPADWPEELAPVRERGVAGRVTAARATRGTPTISFRMPQTISAHPLAVSVMLPVSARHIVRNGLEAHLIQSAGGSILLLLDEQKLAGEILPQLVAQHLGDSLEEYRLSIVRTREPGEVVFASNKARPLIALQEADIKVDALLLRPSMIDRLMAGEMRMVATYAAGLALSRSLHQAPPPPPPSPGGAPGDRFSVMLERPRSVQPADAPGAAQPSMRQGGAGGGSMMAAGFNQGGWQVLLKHRAGSLEAAVERVRRRNLLMSFGMLALLAVSMGLVLVSARRAERLAAQQMDFVATVSHELRTPLAVIRSAGQNLAAGVVQDPSRYGELIETEGRRLTDMVEQTLALAGLSGDRKPMAQQPVDAGDIARSVVAAPETTTRADGVDVELRVAEELPRVLADEMLLRRAVQNLVGNALKYGAPGAWVGVTVDAAGSRRGREVRITVADRGPGVAAEDLPHIFDPFYRGRRAVAEQVQGNGLGLHLVKRIAEAHGGRVTVRTAPGEGAAFTIHLPARSDLAVSTLAAERHGAGSEAGWNAGAAKP